MTALMNRFRFDALPGRWVRRIRRRVNELCVNLVTWHRVDARPGVLDFGGAPRHTPEEFERQIDYLQANFQVMGLRDLLESIQDGRTPPRAVVLTFDDGYADTLRRVMPILFRRRLPMTVFVSTAGVGNRDLLWTHKLAWLLANGLEDRVLDALESSGWTGRQPGESTAQFVRRCYRSDLPMILESVLTSVNQSGPRLAGLLRPYLEPEEMAGADPEWVEFGNHTHTHPVLSALSAEEQRRELALARESLLSITGRNPLAVAYPFGHRRHYNDETRRLVQETWHQAAMDMRRRPNTGTLDPFDLSRKPAAIGSQKLFEQIIEDWPAEHRENDRE